MATETPTAELKIGQDLSKNTIDELQALYDANLNNPQIDPRLLKELRLYIQFKKEGGLSWLAYSITHALSGHGFGDLGMDDGNYYQRM